MKYLHNFFWAGVGFISATIVILIIMVFHLDTFFWSLAMTAAFSLLVGVAKFIREKLNKNENSKQIEEYMKKVKEYQKQLQQKDEIIDMKINECKTKENRDLRGTRSLHDTISSFRTYVRLCAMRSAVGNLRSGHIEKAENKIAEASNMVTEIMQDSIFYEFQFLAEICDLEIEYKKILKGYNKK